VVAGNDEELCDGESVLLDDAQLAVDYERYTWSSDRPGTFSLTTVDNPPTSSDVATTFTPSNGPGSYTVTLTAVDLDGILPETSNMLTVTVNPLPTATISGSTTICAGQATDLTFNLTGSSPWSITYNDGTSDLTVPAVSSPHVVSVDPTSTTTYTLVSIMDDNGCTTTGLTQTAVVQVRDLPTVDAGSDRSVPVNTTVSLTPTLGGSFTDVIWDDGGAGGTFGNALTSNTSYTPPTGFIGLVTLTLTIGDGAGPCDDDISDQVEVTYNESGNVSAGDDQISCDGNTISLNGVADANYEQVLWTSNRSGMLSAATSLNSEFTPTDGAGIYILTLTATDDDGSLPTVNAQLQVDFHSLPQAQFINTDERFICEGETAALDLQLSGNSTNGPWKIVYEDDLGNLFTEENITSSNYQLEVNGVPGESRTYSLVSVEEDNGVVCEGDVISSSVSVTERAQSTARIISGNLDVCIGEPTEISIELSGTGPWNIRWSDNGGVTSLPINGITSSPHTFSVNAPVGVVTTYSLVSVNEANNILCAGAVTPNTVAIKVNESPTASLSGNNSICNGESTDLTINLTGTPPWDVNYSDGTNTVLIDNIASSPFTFSVNPVGTQSYSLVDVSDGNSNNCFGGVSGNALVQVRPLPLVNPSIDATSFCSEEIIQVNGNPSGGSGEYIEHIWSGDGAIFLNQTNVPNPLFQNSVSTTTTYELIYTLRDQNTCEATSAAFSFTVNPRPEVNPIPEATLICSGETIAINGNAVGGIGSLYHSWTGNGAIFLNANDIENPEFRVEVTEETIYELVYSAEDNNGCKDEKSISITVSPEIEIAPLDDVILCQREDLVLNAVVSGKFTDLQWSSDISGTFDNATAANTIFTPDPGVSGVATITLTAIDAGGFCTTDVASLTLEIKEEITVFAGDNQTLCQNETVGLSGEVTGNFTDLQWSTSGMGSLVNANSLNATYTPDNDETGLVTFTLLASDASSVCESSSGEISVDFNRNIDIDISSEPVSCQGEPILIEGTVTGTFSELSWSTENGGTFSNANTTVTTYFPSTDETGFVELTLTALDAGGVCPNTSESVLVEIKPRPLVNAGDNLTINEGETAVVTGEVTGTFDRVEWSSNKGGSFGPVDQVVTVYTPESGEEGFTVLTLTAFDASGICSSVTDQSILEIVPKEPIAQLSSNVTEGCLPLEVTFINESLEAEDNGYFWDFGDGSNIINAVDVVHTFQTAGSYTVTLTATNSSGVTDQATLQITVFDLPTAVFSIDPVEYFIPDPLQITNTSIGGAQYEWDFGDGTTSNEFQPFKVYDTPGEYQVSLLVTSQRGCQAEFIFEDDIIMKEGGSLEIPNAFTPNVTGPGDGRIINFNDNDVFLPVTKGVSEFDMKIYNRWGAQVFESSDPEVGWTGYINNELAASGTYSYVIKIRYSDGQVVDKAGTLNLIR
ncbi:MAG: PKD domain-containing protein, partial [Bacteroidota bacterium]